ncbi:MAG: ribonuclease III [Patescibacteria group bacterium]|nr:ribonuclease III [Patescibacteria group bacterium]
MPQDLRTIPKSLIEKLGIKFKDINLLKTALTHRSYLNEHRKNNLEHNERLEFLGDAVLELITTKYLYSHYNKPEGELTNLRAALVKGETLTKIGKELKIDSYLFLSKGEAKTNGRSHNYILANTIEAVIGAMYLDQGIKIAEQFIAKYIIVKLPSIIDNQLYRDSKSLFQEKAQEKEGITPSYKLVAENGPDHNKHFKVGAYLDSSLIAEGKGDSKQEAQQNAAAESLKVKNWN